MFKPHYGICSNERCRRAGQKVPVVVKKGLCDECNYAKKKAGKPEKRELNDNIKKKIENYASIIQPKTIKKRDKGRKSIKKIYKTTGERNLFMEIWNERLHVSEVSGTPLGEDPKAGFFAHCLSKGAFPGFRLRKDGIFLLTLNEHAEYDGAMRNDPKYKKLKDKAQELKKEYYENH